MPQYLVTHFLCIRNIMIYYMLLNCSRVNTSQPVGRSQHSHGHTNQTHYSNHRTSSTSNLNRGLPRDHITNSFFAPQNDNRAHLDLPRRELYDSSTQLTDWSGSGGLNDSRGSSNRLSDFRGSSSRMNDFSGSSNMVSDIRTSSRWLSEIRGSTEHLSNNRRISATSRPSNGTRKPRRSKSAASMRDIEMREVSHPY